jgi:hypothetical protein
MECQSVTSLKPTSPDKSHRGGWIPSELADNSSRIIGFLVFGQIELCQFLPARVWFLSSSVQFNTTRNIWFARASSSSFNITKR